MEIIIAILWYLQVLFTGVNYTDADIQKMEADNQNEIQAVMQDSELMQTVIDDFNSQYTIDLNGGVGVIEKEEEEEDMEPMPF